MSSQSLVHRNLVFRILGIFSLIAFSITSGCASRRSGGGGTPSLAASAATLGSFTSGEQSAAYSITANYSIDANCRITMIPSSGAGRTAVGWFVVQDGNRFFFVSETGDANGTILSAIH
jgi:hypothetical protein